jgi:hypothetical protein
MDLQIFPPKNGPICNIVQFQIMIELISVSLESFRAEDQLRKKCDVGGGLKKSIFTVTSYVDDP